MCTSDVRKRKIKIGSGRKNWKKKEQKRKEQKDQPIMTGVETKNRGKKEERKFTQNYKGKGKKKKEYCSYATAFFFFLSFCYETDWDRKKMNNK